MAAEEVREAPAARTEGDQAAQGGDLNLEDLAAVAPAEAEADLAADSRRAPPDANRKVVLAMNSVVPGTQD